MASLLGLERKWCAFLLWLGASFPETLSFADWIYTWG